MISKKIFIFYNDDTHFWYSCNVIVKAVHEALADAPEVTWCRASSGVSEADLCAIEKSSQSNEVYVYLVSDNMNYQGIASQLTHLPDIIFIIPIYGNMTVEYVRWPELNKILKGRKVILLSASHRQCQQLSIFVEGATIKKIPYPISSMHFLDLPQSIDNTVHLIYSGRITIQKNIFELMKVFNDVHKQNPHLKLHIAGEFHDRGYHLHGVDIDFEGFKTEFFDFIEASHGGIEFHGFLSQEQIRKLNSQCDYVISMSTYHDEDFGVSVAQSLAQGLVPILSDWGGHPDYLDYVSGHLIPVITNKLNIPTVSTKHLFITLLSLKKLERTTRLSNRNKIADYLSTSSYKRNYSHLLNERVDDYLGQNELFLKYAEICSRWYPFAKQQTALRVEYMDIYKSYLSDYESKDLYKIKA